MELKIVNGDYVPHVSGGFETVADHDEKLARVLYKLSCRKGGFAPFPDLGSRLYKLLREKRESRETLARKYILEALEDESDIILTSVEVSDREGGLLVQAEFEYSGGSKSLAVYLS
ncbi:MAG: hypothetical protein IJ017_07160 [Oscillospiraceae bacterium]|nr:hypothetical protein [Oscillospiraceae bacterium]